MCELVRRGCFLTGGHLAIVEGIRAGELGMGDLSILLPDTEQDGHTDSNPVPRGDLLGVEGERNITEKGR